MAGQITFSYFSHEVQSFRQQLSKFEPISLFTFKVAHNRNKQVLIFLLKWKKHISCAPEIIEKIHGIVFEDPNVKVRELAEAAGIPFESMVKILNEDFGMRKLTAKWVPRLLTIDQKRQ